MTQLLYVVIALVVVCLFVLRWWLNSPAYKGKRGENRVHDILMRLPDDYTILDDVVLRTNRGTTQIDHVVVSKYGLFVVETKNYRGEIYGDDNRKEWTQIIVTDVTYAKKWWKTYTYVTKNNFYNPVKQSLAHLFAIRKIFSKWSSLQVIPIIVFTGSAKLKDVKSRYDVVYDDDLVDTILRYKTKYLQEDEVQKVVDVILHNNVRELVKNEEHVKNIKESKVAVEKKIASGTCPKCGGTLVKRTGMYGNFYGCSNYPKCKFTTN